MAAFVWVICGASRGVGKTHLGKVLREILPDAVQAKLGHGRRKAQGPTNYFRSVEEVDAFVETHRRDARHIVLEVNEWARMGRGDLIVYLEPASIRGQAREDASLLRANAHVRIAPGSSIWDWSRVLRRRLKPPALRERIVDVFFEQARYLGLLQPSVRSKVWVEVCGVRVFGSGLATLLEGIHAHGSLREAAAVAGMSYRRAWELIQTAERVLGVKLAERSAGGRDGGGAVLSSKGERMLRTFVRLDREVAAYADRRFLCCWRESGT